VATAAPTRVPPTPFATVNATAIETTYGRQRSLHPRRLAIRNSPPTRYRRVKCIGAASDVNARQCFPPSVPARLGHSAQHPTPGYPTMPRQNVERKVTGAHGVRRRQRASDRTRRPPRVGGCLEATSIHSSPTGEYGRRGIRRAPECAPAPDIGVEVVSADRCGASRRDWHRNGRQNPTLPARLIARLSRGRCRSWPFADVRKPALTCRSRSLASAKIRLRRTYKQGVVGSSPSAPTQKSQVGRVF
jgi:hypothetical protein